MEFILHNADVYRRPEKYCQTLFSHFLSLNVSGLIYSRTTFGKDPVPILTEDHPKMPTLALAPAGSSKDFCYGTGKLGHPVRYSLSAV